jgi:hypothetical protein
VAVNARGRYGEATQLLHEYGGRDASTSTAGSSSWDEASPRFRTSYESRYGTNRRWDDVEPAHRFGYEAYGRARQSGTHTSWTDEEPKLRDEWSRTYSDRPYDTYRNDVRRGWDYGRGRTQFRDYDNDPTRRPGTSGENAATTAGGAGVGAVAGGAAGAAVGGPVGMAAGAAIGGVAGAAAGDHAVETPEEREDDMRDRRR